MLEQFRVSEVMWPLSCPVLSCPVLLQSSVFTRGCLNVCLCVCVSVCVQDMPIESDLVVSALDKVQIQVEEYFRTTRQQVSLG